MAIEAGNKITTTGIMNQKPVVPKAPDLSALAEKKPISEKKIPSADKVDNIASEASPMEMELAKRIKKLTAEDMTTFQSVLSPSVTKTLSKVFPELKQVLESYGQNEPNVIRMVSDALPKLKFGDQVDPTKSTQELKKGENNVENSFYHLQEKSDAKYMFLITIRDIKADEEITANYNLYTYPKTGVGLQMI